MDAMQISARHNYAATPDQILQMMADQIWLTEVARRAGAQEWATSVDEAGSHVLAALPAPSRAQPFTGPMMKIDLTIRWNPVTAGTSDGRITVVKPGMPAAMSGTAHLTTDGTLSVVDYLAEFTITIPLLGKTLEQAAAPYVRRVVDIQQSVGNDYFAGLIAG